MAQQNKAHTATINRIARRYGIHISHQNRHQADIQADIQCEQFTIEVETTATIQEGIERLLQYSGPVYIAMTNKEGVPDALRLTRGTRVGVMDSQGEIIKESASDQEPVSGGHGTGAGRQLSPGER